MTRNKAFDKRSPPTHPQFQVTLLLPKFAWCIADPTCQLLKPSEIVVRLRGLSVHVEWVSESAENTINK